MKTSLPDEARILRPESKGNERAGGPEHLITEVGLELIQILVHHDHSDAVLPELGEHIRHRSETPELVEIAIEGPSGGEFGVLPAERGKPDRRSEKTPKER